MAEFDKVTGIPVSDTPRTISAPLCVRPERRESSLTEEGSRLHGLKGRGWKIVEVKGGHLVVYEPSKVTSKGFLGEYAACLEDSNHSSPCWVYFYIRPDGEVVIRYRQPKSSAVPFLQKEPLSAEILKMLYPSRLGARISLLNEGGPVLRYYERPIDLEDLLQPIHLKKPLIFNPHQNPNEKFDIPEIKSIVRNPLNPSKINNSYSLTKKI
ncbi:MAG: hypothetical protein C4584_02060 [Armatimonadetes bacterium]|nr:MAG: hypothetical protein C4584_02060 [Armatimonadota bacterium]